MLQLNEPQKLAQRFLIWDQWDQLKEVSLTGEVSGYLDQLACRLKIQMLKTASTIDLRGELGVHSAFLGEF